MKIEIDQSLSLHLANVSFICACLVPSLHIRGDFVENSVGWWIYMVFFKGGLAMVAVPFFFVLSGFLLAGHIGESGWWKSALRKRVRSLFVPYVFWALFYVVFNCCLTTVTSWVGFNFGGGRWSDIDWPFISSALGLDFLKMPRMTHLWYIRSLLVFVVSAPLFSLFRFRKSIFVIGILYVLNIIYPMVDASCGGDWSVSFMKYAWVRGAVFFALGIYLRYNAEFIKPCLHNFYGSVCLVFGLLSCVLIHTEVGRVARGVLTGLAGPLLMIGIWSAVSCSRRWKTIFTSASFPIYVCHSAMATVCLAIFRICGVKELFATSFVLWCVQYIGIVIGCIVLAWLWRRKAPRLYAIAFGGRGI